MKGLLPILSLLDFIYFKLSRLSYPTKTPDNIFRIRLTKYKGKKVILSDGTCIRKNDLLVKIHLQNIRLFRELKDVKNEVKKTKTVYRYVKQSLPALDQYINEHHKSDEIKGILGISLLNKGCERLGFEVEEISNPLYQRFKWTTSSLIRNLAQNRPSLKFVLKQAPPSYLFMSKKKLTRMYRNKK